MRKLVVTVVALAVLAPATALAEVGDRPAQLDAEGRQGRRPVAVADRPAARRDAAGRDPAAGRISQGTLIRTFLARPTLNDGRLPRPRRVPACRHVEVVDLGRLPPPRQSPCG